MSYYNLFVTVLVLNFVSDVRMDEYIDEAQDYCRKNDGFLSCGKYKMLKYVSYLVEPLNDTEFNSVRFIKLNASEEGHQVFTSSRYFLGDTEISKFTNFLHRKLNNYVNYQGFALPLPDGIQILADGTEVGK